MQKFPADSLAWLPYMSGAFVREASYEGGLYVFNLEAGLKWE